VIEDRFTAWDGLKEPFLERIKNVTESPAWVVWFSIDGVMNAVGVVRATVPDGFNMCRDPYVPMDGSGTWYWHTTQREAILWLAEKHPRYQNFDREVREAGS
jgi:hypothetical protein